MAEHKLGRLLQILYSAPTKVACDYLPAAAGILAELGNPLNVAVLSTHLLSAPSLWSQTTSLQTYKLVLSTFYSAALQFDRIKEATRDTRPAPSSGLTHDEWFFAVLAGLNDKLPICRHLVALGGLFIRTDRINVAAARKRLIPRLVEAMQSTLQQLSESPPVVTHALVFVLNHTFEKLPESAQASLDYDALLPVLIEVVYNSSEGMEKGRFIEGIDSDVSLSDGKQKHKWPADSTSFLLVRDTLSRPLMKSLAPLVWVVTHAIQRCTRPASVTEALDSIHVFSATVSSLWRQCHISGIGGSHEKDAFDSASLETSLPVLWRLLDVMSFSVITILRAVLKRTIRDAALSEDPTAPELASTTLYILRDLGSVTPRVRLTEQHSFVALSAIDILSKYSRLSEDFVINIKGPNMGTLPRHPVDRALDLYFFHTTSHFAAVLSPQINEEVLVRHTLPYLTATSPGLRDVFEASHSCFLDVLSSPTRPSLTPQYIRMYAETLFSVFPDLSETQFRWAYKTLLHIASPPSELSNTEPDLAPVLTEMLYRQCVDADDTESHSQSSLTASAVMTLALLDILPLLSVDELSHWLPHVSSLAHRHANPGTERVMQERFWNVLSSGEMDPRRSEVCLQWWSTGGGDQIYRYSGGRLARLPAVKHQPEEQ